MLKGLSFIYIVIYGGLTFPEDFYDLILNKLYEKGHVRGTPQWFRINVIFPCEDLSSNYDFNAMSVQN